MRGGHVDAISRRVVAGWAADPDRPGERLTVSILVDGVLMGHVVADRLRNDLASLGRFGDGKHGFSFAFPEPLGADADHVVRVVFKDGGAKLPNGEQRIAGTAPAVPQTAPKPPSQPAPKPVAARPAAPAGKPDIGPEVRPGQKVAGAPGPGPGPGPGSGARPGPGAKAGPRAAPMTPILVTAPGRSGTTLLMSLLARSPNIVVAELVPYEVRLISYHAAKCHVATAPADLERSTHPDGLWGDGFHIGFNPFQSQQYIHAFRKGATLRDYFDNYVLARETANSADLVREYYRRLAEDRAKPDARFFAEKGNNVHKPTRLFARQAFGAVRELVIVRDPRDVLCSHMAYFSREADRAFKELSHSAEQLRTTFAEQRDDVHFLKYEDMVRGDAACFAAMSAFLGTEITGDAGASGEKVFQKHATSATPEASVERWRTEMPPELQERCAKQWGTFLRTFEYAIK